MLPILQDFYVLALSIPLLSILSAVLMAKTTGVYKKLTIYEYEGGIFLLNGFLKKNFKKRLTIFVIIEILYFETVLLFIDVKKDPILQHVIGLLFFSFLLQFNNYLNLKSTYNNFKKGYITGKLYINEVAKYKTSFIKYAKWFLLLFFLFSITNLHVFAGGANGFFWGSVIIGVKYLYLKIKEKRVKKV